MTVAIRTRRRASSAISPATIFGSALVGWWRSDDLSGLADGAGVASWSDRSANGNTLAQATSGNQPVKQTDATLGLPVARFTLASAHHLFINTPTGLKDAPGPLTILVIAKPAALSGVQTLVEYAGTGNKGFTAEYNGVALGLGDYLHSVSTAAGVVAGTISMSHFEMQSATVAGFIGNNRYTTKTSSSATYAAGSTKLAVGRSLLYNQRNFGGDLYEIIYLNRLVTADEREALARRYVWPRYGSLQGTKYNASNYDATTPTADASSTCVEMSVQYLPSAVGGYKYWMAMVPYGSGSPLNENPHIFASNDGRTWSVPAGVTNPVVAARGTGNNCDPKLVWNTADSKFYLFYYVENDPTSTNNGIYYKTSTDGLTWTAGTMLLQTTSIGSAQEPNVIWDGTQWVLYTHNRVASPYRFERRTCATITGTYSAPSTVTFPIPGSRQPWHMDVIYDSGKTIIVTSDVDTKKNMWIGSSTDGLTFTVAASPVLVPSYDGWDSSEVYRPCLRPPDDTTSNWRLWYTGGVSTSNYHVSYTEIPATEIP